MAKYFKHLFVVLSLVSQLSFCALSSFALVPAEQSALAPHSLFPRGVESEFGLNSPDVAGNFAFVKGPVLGQTQDQDKKTVAGHANKLWFSDEKIAQFNTQGIFVFDIDKTIAGRDINLLEDMIQTIQNLMRAGHLVTIITGQPIDIQRPRIVAPIAPELRQNLVVMTNEGAVAHHFLPSGDEYVVLNDFTKHWYYSDGELDTLKAIVQEFVEERGIEYAPDGKPDNREQVQLSFKIEASMETRLKYKRELEGKIRQRGLEGFQCTASGTSTMSLWKEGIAKNTSGIGFLKVSGLGAQRMTYFGDEFFEYGNDACMLKEKDLMICAVGRYDASLEKPAGATFVGAGPYATQTLLDAFLDVERKERLRDEAQGRADFKDLMKDTAMRQTDWETLAQSYEAPGKTPGEIIHALQMHWILPKTPLAQLVDGLVSNPVQKGGFARLMSAEAKDKMQAFQQILREYRVGALFVTGLYQAAFGNSLEEDYQGMAQGIKSVLPPENMPPGAMASYKERQADFQGLRDTLHQFGGILREYLGDKITGDLLYASMERLMGQKTDWVANTQTRQQTYRTTLRCIVSVEKALQRMTQPHGPYPWLLRVFEGKLANFHRRVDIAAEPPPPVAAESQDDPKQGEGGIVGFGGGGGSRLMGQVLLDSLMHNVLLPGYDNMPFTMAVPSEDDGGSSYNIAAAFLKRYGVILPAMGDDRNASSGLTLGQPNRFNNPHFHFIYDVFRHRFPTDGVGPADSELFQIAYAQIQAMARSKIVFEEKDWQRLVHFLLHVFDVFEDFHLTGLEGNSLGNVYWTAYHAKTGAIPVRPEDVRGKTVTMSEDLFVKGQRGMARDIGLGNMLVLPSNLNPGTLYVLMKDMEIFSTPDPDEKPECIKIPAEGKTIRAGAHEIFLQEEEALGTHVSADQGHTHAAVDLGEGESLLISNRGKIFTLEQGADTALFRTQIKKEAGTVQCRHTVGAEEWGPWRLLTPQETVVGIAGNAELSAKAADQLHWGARVALSGDGKVRVTLDRTGEKTMLKWPGDGAQRSLKSRIIVRQTRITETHHHSKILKAGMVDGKVPKSYGHFLKMIDKAQVGVVIGPASVVTSILPILMIKEVRDALKRKAAEGIPVMFVVNATKDNETAMETVSSLFELIEESVGERVFGKGGFVTDVIANDTRDIPEHLLPLIDMTDADKKTTKLRPAERPRGVLGLSRAEEEELARPDGRNLRIHLGSLLTSMQREVRGGVPEESVGYDTVRLGRLIESAVLARNIEKVRESPKSGYKEALAIFRGNERALWQAVNHILATGHLRGQLEALALIRTQYEGKRALTPELLKSHAPRVIVSNLFSTILPSREFEMTASMAQKLNGYFEAGGYLVVDTGYQWSLLAGYLFGRENAVRPEYRERIYFITTSGGELYRADGVSLLEQPTPMLPFGACDVVEDELFVYEIQLGVQTAVQNRGPLIAATLAYHTNSFTPADVDAWNETVRANTSLSPVKRRELIIRWVPGVVGSYDLRTKLTEFLNERFKDLGLNILAEESGRATVDVRWKDVSDARTFGILLDKADQPISHIDLRNMLIVGRGASNIASAYPEIPAILHPDIDPRALFLGNALPLELKPDQKNPEWNPETFERILEISTEALKTQGVPPAPGEFLDASEIASAA